MQESVGLAPLINPTIFFLLFLRYEIFLKSKQELLVLFSFPFNPEIIDEMKTISRKRGIIVKGAVYDTHAPAARSLCSSFFFLDDEPNFRNFERPTSVARNS